MSRPPALALPQYDALLRRLYEAEHSTYLRDRLLPIIARKGQGQRLNASGIALLVFESIGEYGATQHPAEYLPTLLDAEKYIDALVPPSGLRTAAREAFKELIQA